MSRGELGVLPPIFPPGEASIIDGNFRSGTLSIKVFSFIPESWLTDDSFMFNLCRHAGRLLPSPAVAEAMDAFMGPQKTDLGDHTINTIPIYIVQPSELRILLAEPSLSRATKVASTILSIYPWTRRNPPASFKAQPLPQVIQDLHDQPEEEKSDSVLTDEFHKLIISIGTTLLCYGYSQDTRRAGQISRRLAAAYADADLPAPDLPSHENAIKEYAGSSKEINGDVVELIGQVVALHRDGYSFPAVTEAEYAVASQDARLKPLPRIFSALREQMMLVFTNYQSSTVRWALNITGIIRESGFTTQAAIAREIEHLEGIRDEIEKRPFVGLVSKIASSHQQSNFPLLTYLGCYYHARHLDTEEQRKAFEGYNISGIAQRVAEPNMVNTCEVILQNLPAPQLAAKANLLHAMQTADVDKLLATMKQEEATQIVQQLETRFPGCEWAREQARRKAQAAKEEFYIRATELLRKRWTDAKERVRKAWSS